MGLRATLLEPEFAGEVPQIYEERTTLKEDSP